MMEIQRRPSRRRLQKRHILVLIANLMVFSMHTMRNVAMGTVQMYNDHRNAENKSNNTSAVCNVINLLKHSLTPIVARRDVLYHWSQKTETDISTVFYASLHATHILGGILSDKLNPKSVMLVCLSGHTVMTLLMPLVILNIKGNWRALMGWNVIHGLIQGPIYPALFSIFGQWVPSGEKTISIGLINATMSIAFVAYEVLGVLIINAAGHWQAVYYAFGGFGVLTNLLWFFLCYPSPELHPRITLEEKEFIREKRGPYYSNRGKRIPWKKMALSVPLWTLVLNFMGWQWAWFTVMFEFPNYLRTVLKLDYGRFYLQILIIPNTCIVIAYTLGGLVCDIMIRREIVDITTLRKIYNNLGSMGTNSFTIIAAYAYCDQAFPVYLYSVILSFMAFFYTGAMVNILDLAPNFGGTIYGLTLTISHLISFIRPLATEKLIRENNVSGWKSVFWFSFGVCAFANLIYVFFCKATEASWNIPEDRRSKKNRS